MVVFSGHAWCGAGGMAVELGLDCTSPVGLASGSPVICGTQTYAHLQELSLEFFGGKRTGDLMSRISTDTDRICVFLSVSLVDFVNDMVMILITAGLLLWKDARLAVCTLTTFPIILWLVYGVRRRLRHGFDQSIVATAQLNSVLADTIRASAS